MPHHKKIKILFAEDHEIFRLGFRRIIETASPPNFEFVTDAINGIELVEKVKQHKPNLVLTDIKMPLLDGIQACKLIKQQNPLTNVIAFSHFDKEKYIIDMMNAGAHGYLVKSGTMLEVFEAIDTVSEGRPYYCSSISDKLYGVFQNSNTYKLKNKKINFSLQEIKVIKLICEQLTSKEIAQALQLAVRTVEDYRHQIQEKIGARNVVGIALYAIVNGITQYNELL